MGGILFKIRSWWDSADRSQKTITVVGGAFLLALLIGTFMFASKPKMSMLYGGLDPSEQGAVTAELDKDGIQYDFNSRGDVMVPTDQVAAARMKLAAAGKLPSSTNFGDQDFSKIGLGTTPSVEREQLKAMLEQRLADSIDTLDGVSAATVHLNLGEQSPFVQDKQDASASVTVTAKPGVTLSSDQGRTIALLIANSVPGLTMQNVAVVDSQMQLLFDGKNAQGADGQAETKLATEEQEAKRRERELQAKLDAAFGPGSTICSVNLELDFDHLTTDQVDNTPSDQPISKTSTQEKLDGSSSGAVGGIAGTAANVGAGAPATPAGSPGSNDYSNKQDDSQYLVNTKTTHMEQAPGTLKSMAISVIADSTKVPDTTAIQGIIQGYLGDKYNTPGFTGKVTSVKFDTASQKAATQAASTLASQQRMQQILSILPVAALLVVAALVVKQIGKFGRGQTIVVATPEGHMVPLPASGLPVPQRLLAGADQGPMDAHALTQALEQISVKPGMGAGSGGGGFSANGEPADIGSIESKVNVPLEQIKKMSEERPEVVAVLIKSWLLEDRR